MRNNGYLLYVNAIYTSYYFVLLKTGFWNFMNHWAWKCRRIQIKMLDK